MTAQIKTMDDALALAAAAGSQTADGIDSIMSLALVAFRATRAKIVDKDNIGDIYSAYLSAANKAEFAAKTANEDAIKFGVSKLRVFVRLAAHKGSAQDVWDGVVGGTRKYLAKKGEAGKKVGSIYEQVLKVARFSLSKEIGSHKLSAAQIEQALAPKEGDEVDEILSALQGFVNKSEKLLAREENPITVGTHFLAAALAEAKQQLADYKASLVGEVSEDDDVVDETATLAEAA